jgi:hypothetical protein
MQTPVQPPHHALSQRDELACWRHWIAQGNLAFQSRNYSNALAHYQQARASVRPLLFNASDGADATIAAWVIAHLNLADACEQLGQSDEQGLHLCTAHETLCCAAANTHLADDWRMAAWQHSRRTSWRAMHVAIPTMSRPALPCSWGRSARRSALFLIKFHGVPHMRLTWGLSRSAFCLTPYLPCLIPTMLWSRISTPGPWRFTTANIIRPISII